MLKRLVAGIACVVMLSSSAVADSWSDGVTAYTEGDYATALKLWQPLAERGDPRAENNLGVLYEKGLGVSVDLDRAASWYLKAAEQDHAAAQKNLRDLITRRASETGISTAARIKELDDDTAAWRRARIVNSPASYQAYIAKWPNGRFVSEAENAKEFQQQRRLDRTQLLSGAEKVAGYLGNSELFLGSLNLRYASERCMADKRFREVSKGFGIAASLYYASNWALRTDALGLSYPYRGLLKDKPTGTNFRDALSILTPEVFDRVARTVSKMPTAIGLLKSAEVLAFLNFVIDYREKFSRRVDPALLAKIDEKIWAEDSYGFGDLSLFYDLGFTRDACFSEDVYIGNIRVRSDQRYITTVLEPWAYGFWYRRTIEGSDDLVYSLLTAARAWLSTDTDTRERSADEAAPKDVRQFAKNSTETQVTARASAEQDAQRPAPDTEQGRESSNYKLGDVLRAHKQALDAERRKEAAEAAAGAAADKVMASAEAEAEARQAADEAARLAAQAGNQLVAAREAVETARAEVARLEEAKKTVTEEAERILASATEKLRGAGQRGLVVTEEEANRLRAEVALAIQAADDAGRALADAQVALTAAEEEVARLETETERSRATAGEASSRAAEAVAALIAAEEGAQTAKANAEAMKQAAEESMRRFQAVRSAAKTEEVLIKWNDCIQPADRNLALRSCGEVITAGQETLNKVATAYQIRGNAHASKGDYDRALADYNKAIQIDPNEPLSYTGRGFAHRSKGEYDMAIADYSKAIEIDSDDVTAYVGRSMTYRKKGDPDRAAADCDRARRIMPNVECSSE